MTRERLEFEAQEEVRKIERENALKVLEMLRAKASGKKMETPVSSYKSYEEAKQAGDINAMMYFKTGGAERARQAEELEKVMNTDIKTVMYELRGIDNKIIDAENKLKTATEQVRATYEQDFRNKVKGMKSYERQYIMFEQEYFDKVDAIGNIEGIKALSYDVKALKERRTMLNSSKEHYVKENQAYINEARRIQKLKEIQESGLLIGDID